MPPLASSALATRAPRAGPVSSRHSSAASPRGGGGSASARGSRGFPSDRRSSAPPRRPPALAPSPAPPRAVSDADEEIIPLLRAPPTAFTDEQLEALAHPHLLRPGSTMREELEALREAYLGAEEKALKGEAKLFSANWEGDVYVGSRWNVATVLALVSAATTAAGLAFAFATKGVLWGLVDYYGY